MTYHPTIENLPHVLHLTRFALVPSLRSLPCPSFAVSLDPHLGQLGTSPLNPLDSCTVDCTSTSSLRERAFSEACFVSFVMLFVAGLVGTVFSCAIVLSSAANRSSAARLSASAFFRVLPPVTASQEVSTYR